MEKPLSEVSGVVTFYSFFATQPRGKHVIRVCLGTACYVRGGKKIISRLQEMLGVEVGGTTKDGLFTFEVARCIGACGLAPAIMIDDVVYNQVNLINWKTFWPIQIDNKQKQGSDNIKIAGLEDLVGKK